MATQATDVLSLDDAKGQLYIPPDDDSRDAKVRQALRSAVSTVQRLTDKPLLDVTLTALVDRPADRHAPVFLPHTFIHEITAVAYWETDQALREAPTGSVTVGDLGRRHQEDGGAWLYPPAAGWPAVLRNSRLSLTLLRRYDPIPETDEEVRHGVILFLRHYFEQPERMESDFAVYSLMRGAAAELVP